MYEELLNEGEVNPKQSFQIHIGIMDNSKINRIFLIENFESYTDQQIT